MKKLKIMLLSLALIAVVGGALAFKAKFNEQWCVTDAFTQQVGPDVIYYCEFNPGSGIITKDCPDFPESELNAVTTGDDLTKLRFCTTLSINGPQGPTCPQDCPVTTTTKLD